MNWTIEFTPDFSREAKTLSKHYKSFKDDLRDFKDSIIKNPFQGTELIPGIRKIRFLIIYDKSDADTVDVKVVRNIVKDLGFDLEPLQKEGRLREKEADK